jgi:predicted RNase H-like nuclease (RuvC/YqgF family)
MNDIETIAKDRLYGGHGKCSICGQYVSNVAHHESACEKRVKATSDALINHAQFNRGKLDYTPEKQVDFSHVFKSDKDRIKELEEENAKLKASLIALNDKLDSAQKRVNRMYDDTYNDVTIDREDR